MQTNPDFDVVVIGGNLLGAMAAIMLQRRGVKTLVLEARPAGKEQKVVVGEAITEGSSVFLRHEIGLTDWLKQNVFRKFGFDFLTPPRRPAGPGESGPQSVPVTSIEDCHELMLSTTPLEHIAGAVSRLIPTYHVERTSMNRHVVDMAIAEGADYRAGANVEHVRFDGAELPRRRHEVIYSRGGETQRATCRWVLDCSGRRAVLSRQLGLLRQVHGRLDTASVWNRFDGVETDPAIWRGFHGIDRRRHTIHMTGPGFWIWWIHQRDDLTSVGISYDNEQHQPDVKTDDRGFWEMMGKFPPVLDLLKRARPLEPYQYYAHLPYQSERWIDGTGYTLIGDAAWFTDALYSIGIETGCRQLVNSIPLIVGAVRGQAPCEKELAGLNREFRNCQNSVLELNRFKYKHAWHRPHTLIQSAVYELGEIAELYYLRDKQDWRPEVLRKHYRLQWYSKMRQERLQRFLEGALADGDRDLEPGAGLLKKALLPGPSVYRATWPLWKLRRGLPHFFNLIRGWAYAERWTQRHSSWPDGLHWMATSERAVPPQLPSAAVPSEKDRRAALAG